MQMCRLSPSTSPHLLGFGFNQDATCVVLATLKGVRIISLATHQLCAAVDVGAVATAGMLYCTSLLAWVGAGEQPTMSPRRLTLYNTATSSVIQHLSFPSTVLAAHLSRQHVCVILERRAMVYALESLQPVAEITTPPNPKGLGALTLPRGTAFLALPASNTTGTVAVHPLPGAGGGSQSSALEISAHQTPLSILAWSDDAALLATASTKGTVVRVFRMPHGDKAFTLRRGTTSARITSLAFTPSDCAIRALCVASDHASVHIFTLGRARGGRGEGAVKSVLSNVIAPSLSSLAQRPSATVRLHCRKGAAVACAVLGTSDAGNEDAAEEGDGVRLAVATAEGILYQYHVQGLGGDGGAGIKSTLEGEWLMK